MSNSYGIRNSDAVDHKFGWYDNANGEWTGTWYESREEAQEAVNAAFAIGDVDATGVDPDDWCVASTTDPLDYLSPANA
jgi:hypothetical protein